jgi:hypothetical protein
MSPVGGSRHYGGGGLGQEGGWRCPSCGAQNDGPIAQGCQLCGAGRPGQKADGQTVEAEPPPPPPASATASIHQGDVADRWARDHDDVTIAEAYRAGYQAGIRAARAAAAAPSPAPAHVPDDVNQKITRTICVALAMFRDQVLVNNPEEVDSGEWMSAEETTRLIRRLQLEMEPAHA